MRSPPTDAGETMEKHFIKPDLPFEAGFRREDHAPLFRKRFLWNGTAREAKIRICALGVGYCYLNGRRISADLFTAPVSDYAKTLWYNTYDVSTLLQSGENILAVHCGNGWYNESFRTVWKAPDYRPDLPKVTLSLEIDGVEVLTTNGTWKCLPDSATRFNQLRSGEWFDATRYDPAWADLSFDDSAWPFAKPDDAPPSGILRECPCEPIREFEIAAPQRILKTGERTFVFDMGVNRSGYIRLTAAGVRGQTIAIRYAESLNDDGSLCVYGLSRFYPESEFQTDRFTCSGEEIPWSPSFAYHGFRYIELSGISSPDEVTVRAVFVHQAVAKRTSFRCSDPFLNRLFAAGQTSCLSNMFYLFSDCPTREKMGWTDDAQMSAEQMFTDFAVEKLAEKWMQDIYDAMRGDGMLPGVIPTKGWGYEWGNGPLSDGVLFELPYRYYLHTGKPDLLAASLPCFRRYLSFLQSKENEEGLIPDFGLGDWATAGNPKDIPVAFVNLALAANFYRIAALAERLSGNAENAEKSERLFAKKKSLLGKTFLRGDGTCAIDKMSAVAIIVALDLYDNIQPLSRQLKRLTEENGCRHDCGILGLRCLYHALSKCGLQENAYRILTASGFPSYRFWFEHDATSLWEYFTETIPNGEYVSKNHHMYSDFMSWIVKNILGITHDRRNPNAPEFTVRPFFFSELSFAEGEYETDRGKIRLKWEKQPDRSVKVEIRVDGRTAANYRGRILTAGNHVFSENILT